MARDAFADEDLALALEAEKKKEKNKMAQKAYDKMTPEEVFAEFDVDGSGGIDWPEFKAMLPKMGVNMNEAKALKYFQMCDTDGGGDIDLDEFRSALFAIDPNTGNSTGFQPSALLTPQDAFELFDVDKSGNIDEDEFAYVMEYMKVEMDPIRQETMFNKYDSDGSGSIGYDEFKQIWVKVANLKKELADREIKVPKLATRGQLEKLMLKELEREEAAEAHALAEADQFKRWTKVLTEKKKLSNAARRRAMVELRGALDLAGQVYTFGEGAYGQFGAAGRTEMGTKEAPRVGFAEVAELWHGRVVPKESFLAKIGSDEKGAKKLEDLQVGVDIGVDDPRTEILYSPFNHAQCNSNTAALWARRIKQVSLCANVAVALSELGELFVWGGTSQWWHEVEADSEYRGKFRGMVTARSQLLLQTSELPPPEKEDDDEGPEEVASDPEDAECVRYKDVLSYFGKWKAPPVSAPRLSYYRDHLFPLLEYSELALACEVRGKKVASLNKAELMKMLYADMVLERRVLGLRAHRKLREQEEEIHHLLRRKKKKSADRLVRQLQRQWQPVLEMQAETATEFDLEQRKAEEKALIRRERGYAKLRETRHANALDGAAEYTPRGGSVVLEPSGVTARAGGVHDFKGYAAVVAVACGAHHVSAVHLSGELYTWGFGSAGRLGLDLGGDRPDPRSDAAKPTLVQALLGLPVANVSCGYAHSAAVTCDARLFVWGSGATGKLGLGPVTAAEECYCSVPTPLVIGDSVRVRSVSCGASHSACVSDRGEVYVWGCADGGRLGLGSDRLTTQYRPVKVSVNGEQGGGNGHGVAHAGPDHRPGTPAFGGERAALVSCGNAHTLVVTAVREVVTGVGPMRTRVRVGGAVFMAGAQSVLGRHCPIFVRNEKLAAQGAIIKRASAGFAHCAAAAASGELYCWGSNFTGCCGAPFPMVQFCYEPYNVPCIYAKPLNLCLGKAAAQSSCYNGQDAFLGVDGDTDGSDAATCTSTGCEAQPWWEVDLGDYCVVQTVRVWNRTDEPPDPSFDRETFRERLFPAYALLSQEPFPRDRSERALGGAGLTLVNASLDVACARMKLTKNQRCTTWLVPENTTARYFRLILEGFNFLHFAQVEILGTRGINKPVGRCGEVCAGRNVTTAVVLPSREPADYSTQYRRAVWADAHNADILRQYESYAAEFDKYGRGERIRKCATCKGGQLCETCSLYERFRDELEAMPALGSVGTQRRALDDLVKYLMDAPKPPLNYEPKVKEKKSFLDKFKFGGRKKKNKKKEKGAEEGGGEEAAEDKKKKKKEKGDDEAGEEEEDEEEESRASKARRKGKGKK